MFLLYSSNVHVQLTTPTNRTVSVTTCTYSIPTTRYYKEMTTKVINIRHYETGDWKLHCM